MSVDFNRIKKYSKTSNNFDEKLECLDKELKKTGLDEMANTTSGVYVGNKEQENQDYSDFVGTTEGGYGLGLSGADGNNIGGAVIQTGEGGIAGVEGVAYSPPHPITGLRTYATHVSTGLGDRVPLRPGVTIGRGFSDNPPQYTMGSVLWFFDPTYNFAGQQGQWCYFEFSNFDGASNGKWFFWDTIKTGQFAGIYIVNTNLSQHPCAGDGLADKIAGLNFGTNGAVGAPQTTVLTQTRLDDPGHLPIDIKGLSKQAFDFLKGKAQEALDFMGGAMEKMKENWETVKQQGADFGEDVQEFINDKKEDLAELGKAAEVYIDYLAGNLNDGDIDNDYLGQDYVDMSFEEAEVNDKGTVSVGENIIGSGGKPQYNPDTGVVTIPFEYDFDTNEEQIMKDPNKYDPRNSIVTAAGMVSAWILGGKYGLDSTPVPFAGYATWLSKTMGKGNPTTGHGITMPIEEVKEKNPNFYNYIIQNKIGVSESYISESAKLGHFEPEVLNVNIDDLRKGIAPEFPKDPPPEMIDGYSVKSRLAPKKIEGSPFIKITKKDIAQNHLLTDKQISDFMNDIKMINDYIKKNPADLIYVQQRYPKHDPRLAQLNWQMDQMLDAGKEYIDKQFPENQKLFDKIKKKIKNTIDQTDPKNFKGTKLPKFDKTHLEDFKRKKEVYSRFMKKPVKTKKLFKK